MIRTRQPLKMVAALVLNAHWVKKDAKSASSVRKKWLVPMKPPQSAPLAKANPTAKNTSAENNASTPFFIIIFCALFTCEYPCQFATQSEKSQGNVEGAVTGTRWLKSARTISSRANPTCICTIMIDENMVNPAPAPLASAIRARSLTS